LTLAALSDRSGIDQGALSKLETGSHGNPTLETLYRVALALGKVIVCVLQDAPADRPVNERLARPIVGASAQTSNPQITTLVWLL
jgi:transcriptional regulator with XRE-family HTH domain